MKKTLCVLFAVSVLICTFTISASADNIFSFDTYEEFKTYVLDPEEYEEQAEDYNENWYTFDKEFYYDFDKLFDCKSGVIVPNNSCIFYFESKDNTEDIEPQISIQFKKGSPFFNSQKNDNSSDGETSLDLYSNDFTEKDSNNVSTAKFVTVEKDGYTFKYLTRNGAIESVHYDTKDYLVFFTKLDKTTDAMAEYHNIYKSEEETVKVIKRFEDLINGTLTEDEPTQNTSAIIITISILAAVLVAVAVGMFFIKRSKAKNTILNNSGNFNG